ncbi:hypothetical protein B0H16DRAFT_49896 [Mycena metata]|uniref:Protein kinase domain-containing protein n=1 Tax=Mycena metata TaxID=1033252 RepID=A0AAD7N0C6_9AGAR|nr:hypothetical protein B0H16DRAFT_49896 [Mycena metata]
MWIISTVVVGEISFSGLQSFPPIYSGIQWIPAVISDQSAGQRTESPHTSSLRRMAEVCRFPVDVYCLGNSIRRYFTQGWKLSPDKKGFTFMEDLLSDMCQEDPNARPEMDEVVARFEKIRRGLSELKLRSRVARKDENLIAGVFCFNFHWARQVVPIPNCLLSPETNGANGFTL